MIEPPTPASEPERLQALQECGVLDTAAEREFDDLVELVRKLCDMPIALVSLVDEHRQWFKSVRGLEVRETPRRVAFCAHTVANDRELIVRDAALDPRFCENPLVTGFPFLRFYAGIPLRSSDGYALGSLCVLDSVPRELSPGQHEDLRRMGRQASRLLELRRQNYLLDRAREQAEANSRATHRYLANMSHEIRTPLNAITGYIDLLLDPQESASAHSEYGEILKRNSKHLVTILNDMLDLSKIDAGHMPIEQVACSPAQKVIDVTELMRPRAEAKGLSLEVDFLTPVPRVIYSDPLRVKQILMNLVSNAIKFTDSGSVLVRVTCLEHTGGASATLQYEVIDTGIGISEATLGKLFKPFGQAEDSTARKYGGTGLGLTISRKLARMLGGDITVASREGAGSTFTLTLDSGEISNIERDLTPWESLQHLTTEAGRQQTKRYMLAGRALVVDDMPDNRKLASHLLSKSGMEVEQAVNGQEALDAVNQAAERGKPFDLVLLDMQMPVMDGFDAASGMRQRGHDSLPIIALTACALREEVDRALASGCDEIARKPIDRDALFEACERLLTSGRGACRRQDAA